MSEVNEIVETNCDWCGEDIMCYEKDKNNEQLCGTCGYQAMLESQGLEPEDYPH